jgi:hypothetical protein
MMATNYKAQSQLIKALGRHQKTGDSENGYK